MTALATPKKADVSTPVRQRPATPRAILAFVEHHLAQEQTDVVHDLLAFLAEKMIAMNKAKQAEVKGFLAWLSRESARPSTH